MKKINNNKEKEREYFPETEKRLYINFEIWQKAVKFLHRNKD